MSLLAGVLLSGLVSSTCQWDVGTLDIRLVYAAGASDPFGANSIIRDFRITVEGEGIHTRRTIFTANSKRSGRLQGIPVGERVRVTVEGMDHIGTIGYRGVSREFTVHSGTNKLFLFFSQTHAFSGPPTVQAAIAPTWQYQYRPVLRPGFGRAFHTASVLTDGTVLVAGGTQTPDPTDHLAVLGANQALRSAEIFDPTAGAFFKDSRFCLDNDDDGWGWGPDCLGLDCNDANADLTDTCGSGCSDVDGDGYGLGDDCLGPDCEDGVGGEDCAIGACCGECPDSSAGLCMAKTRAFHTALPLPGGDSWLFLGGEPGGLGRPPAEAFSLSTMAFQQVASETMGIRSRQVAARLGPETMIIGGGVDGTLSELGDIRAADSSLDFEAVGSMSPARAGALVVDYPNAALIVGGWEVFSPKADRVPSDAIERVRVSDDEVHVESLANLHLHLARAEAAGVAFKADNESDGILVCGGLVMDQESGALEPTDTCERISPGNGTVDFLGPVLAQPRWGHTMTLLPGNKVLVAGGFKRTFSGAGLNAADILSNLDADYSKGEVINVEMNIRMAGARGGHTATLMPNGMVLLVGGISGPGEMSSPGYEIYNP